VKIGGGGWGANTTLIKTTVIGAAQHEAKETSRMFCARQVFRCFKFIEKLGERLVGAVGPYFVAAAVILISVGAVCFCTSGSPPTPPGRLLNSSNACISRSYMANAILPLDHDANMPPGRVQSIRALLLCLQGLTWFRRRSSARNRHRILLVRATTGT